MCQRHEPLPGNARVEVTSNIHVHGPAFTMRRVNGLSPHWVLRAGDVDILLRDTEALSQLAALAGDALHTEHGRIAATFATARIDLT